MTTINRKYTWKKDVHDPRDRRYRIVAPMDCPEKVDLRSHCPSVYDQGQIGSCHDDLTEILTEHGWVNFPELTPDFKLASVDPKTKAIIFEYPSRIIALPYSGIMIKGKHQSLDFMVTPDHNMLVRTWNESKRTLNEDFELLPAKNLGWYSGLLGNIENSGTIQQTVYILPEVSHKHASGRGNKEIPINTWLEFLGIYLAEGTLLKDKKNKYKIQLAASKSREKEFIKAVLNSMNQHYLELKDRFTFQNKQLYMAMESLNLFGVKAPQKFVPEFVFGLSGEQIKHFLLGHFMGDGSEQNGTKTYYSSSKQLVEDIQRLLFLSGSLSGMSERPTRTSTMRDGRVIVGKYPEYSVRQLKTNKLSIDKKVNIKEEFYNGIVYCAEVPTYHTLVTRRKGKILISGNCTANAIAADCEFNHMKQGEDSFMPARLGIYYLERQLEGTINEDSGAQLRDGIKVVAQYGVFPEDLLPYDESNFLVAPTEQMLTEGAKHQALMYEKLDGSLDQIKHRLACGYPFVFGFMVYQDFESKRMAMTGKMLMPKPGEQCLGGHAVMAVGYDDNEGKGCVLVRNSWGPKWGQRGYFWMPYEFITNPELATDMWAITRME